MDKKYLGKNQSYKVIGGKKYLTHSVESAKASGGTVCKDRKKIEKYILDGKVPNGTGGFFVIR